MKITFIYVLLLHLTDRTCNYAVRPQTDEIDTDSLQRNERNQLAMIISSILRTYLLCGLVLASLTVGLFAQYSPTATHAEIIVSEAFKAGQLPLRAANNSSTRAYAEQIHGRFRPTCSQVETTRKNRNGRRLPGVLPRGFRT